MDLFATAVLLADATAPVKDAVVATAAADGSGLVGQFARNFVNNLFQPLLLFFAMGFLVPILKVPFEFPKAFYQSLTIYLLIAIGWHGGEEMAKLQADEMQAAGGLMLVGFVCNTMIGITATAVLPLITKIRKIDATTIGAYYGSDSAGTFVTCTGMMASLGLAFPGYMPVLLAVMEVPGCLVGLYLVSRLRAQGMDANGNMPDEPGYNPAAHREPGTADDDHGGGHQSSSKGGFNLKVLHEVFLNPGLYLLLGSIVIGFISELQSDRMHDPKLISSQDKLFNDLFKAVLCLFLLEMGMTACSKLKDLRTAGAGFVLFGILAPNVFAVFGLSMMHTYSHVMAYPLPLGAYPVFAVLCASASYIALPAIQRLAIPEASPTLPLAASLGLTFTYNVTLGIPIYTEIARFITTHDPVVSAVTQAVTGP